MKHTRKARKFLLTATFAVIIAFSGVFLSPDRAQADSGWQFPCDGYGVSGYSFGQYVSGWGVHVGEDVCSQAGRAVYAAADGTVMYSAKTPDSYRWGNLVLIQHTNDDGSTATGIYGHLSADRRVSADQTVAKGQLIGFVGPSWTADNGNWSAHLHFGIKTGAYGAAVGTYAPGISGYRSDVGPYAHPSNYIRGRQTPPIVYDYQVVGTYGHGVYGKNQDYYVEFHLRNTGNATWYMNGPQAMKLGTSRPRDRLAAFANGSIGHGWYNNQRIALLADTPPGAVGVFRARFSNRTVAPGSYIERFEPVIDGMGWLGDKDLSVGIQVLPPRYAAQWVSQGAHHVISPTYRDNPQDLGYLVPGQKMNVKAYLRNVGDYAWTSSGPNPTRLGNTGPRDRASAFATGGDSSIPLSENWPRYDRPSNIDGRLEGNGSITPTDTIQPGEVAVFSFAITAPNAPGEYIERFNPVIEGHTWLNDLGMWYRMRVLPPGYHYEWVTQENPGEIQLGRTSATATVYLRNAGQTAWPVNGDVKLGTDRERDRASAFSPGWLSPNRPTAVDENASNPAESIIRPGQVAKFEFNVQSSTVRDSTYREYLKPLRENVTWFPEDYGIFTPVTVNSPERDYQVLSQTFSRPVNNLRYGDEFTATLAVRNLGVKTWTAGGANPVRMGTERPRDRLSGFSNGLGLNAWSSASRPSAIDGLVTNLNPLTATPTGTVAQSQVAYFTVPMKVPFGLPPGRYNEHFNLVEEDLSWFPDLGIFFPLDVLGP